MEPTKYCSKCENIKPRSQFNKSTYAKDGLQSRCRKCQSLWKTVKKVKQTPTYTIYQPKPQPQETLTARIAKLEERIKKLERYV